MLYPIHPLHWRTGPSEPKGARPRDRKPRRTEGPEGHDGRRKAGDQEGEPRDKTGLTKSPTTGNYPLSVT